MYYRSEIRSLIAMFAIVIAGLTPLLAQEPPRVDPKSPEYIRLPEFGRMIGLLDKPVRGTAEYYGERVTPLGDLNHDGRADWAVSHYRCDTVFGTEYPEEALLYFGEQGMLPSVSNATRIGPTELGSASNVLCAGDWNGDGEKDLAVGTRIIGDTSGASHGLHVERLTIFWNNGTGGYSINDTTDLPADGDMWFLIRNGKTADFNEDGVDDLLIRCAGVVTAGKALIKAQILIFAGIRGKKWGHNDAARSPVWMKWNVLNEISEMEVRDHDCDSHQDIILGWMGPNEIAQILILYGRSRAFPDTSELQFLSLSRANGHHYLFADVTGDQTAELIVNGSVGDRMWIYAGRPGQRLSAQYGSGYDTVTSKEQPWRRPWAQIVGPYPLHDGWTGTKVERLYTFGDLNFDGTEEFFTYSHPFLIGYSTGIGLDSLIDVLIANPGDGIRGINVLGDIDGSGVNTIALSFRITESLEAAFPGGIVFYKATKEVSTWGTERRKMPHLSGEYCAKATSVGEQQAPRIRGFQLTHNPTLESIHVSWESRAEANSARVVISDLNGRMMADLTLEITSGGLDIPLGKLPAGVYLVRVDHGTGSETTSILIP